MIKQTLALVGLTLSMSANAAVVEVGDLNIINDGGNASDGLRFLDSSYSRGLILTDALANAQLTYSDARLATASEWDDLFSAAGINYNGTLSASDTFEVGPELIISSGSNYDAGVLQRQLGDTQPGTGRSLFWSDPDGSLMGTRDVLTINQSTATIYQIVVLPSQPDFGWLIVSEVATVPVPAAAWLFGSALLGLGALKRKKA